MHLYDIGYHSCEESGYWQFAHEKLFSEGELFNVVEDCLYECLKIAIEEKRERDKILEEKWDDELSSRISREAPTIQDAFFIFSEDSKQRVFVEEMEKRGFKKLEFEKRLSLFGWSSALNPQDWPTYNTDETKEMIRRFRRRYEAENT